MPIMTPGHDDSHQILDRALPATMIDLVRDGVSPRELRRGADRAVYSALARVACSARQRGWLYDEWATEVLMVRSRLGAQVRLKGGRKERSDLDVEKTLRSAWDAAGKWLAEAPPALTRHDAELMCKELRDLISDPDVRLSDADRVVLGYAVMEGLRRGTTRPTLPRRTVVTETGLGDRAVRNSLARLEKSGLLVCEIRGVSAKPNTKTARASAYRLPDRSKLAALATQSTTQEPAVPSLSSTPSLADTTTISAKHLQPDQRARVAALLAEMGCEFAMHTNDHAMPVERSGNVVPIRKGRTA